MTFFKSIFKLIKRNAETISAIETEKLSSFDHGKFNLLDFPEEHRNKSFYLSEYFISDGEWVDIDEPICQIAIVDKNDFVEGILVTALHAGILQHTLNEKHLLSNNDFFYILHQKGIYQNEKSHSKYEYREYFKNPNKTCVFDSWLIEDGSYVKNGDPIFQFKDYENGVQISVNYSKRDGFIHQIQFGKFVSLSSKQPIYVIRDTDKIRIEKRFNNIPNIIVDEFTNSTNISWFRVSCLVPERGINTASFDCDIDLIFSFNYINGSDNILFDFNPKQIRPKKFDKVSFLFQNGEQIEFELATNPSQSKNILNENILEYKSILTKNELYLFATSNFIKWKISLENSSREYLGGDIGNDNSFYTSKQNIQIAIKKFANDYINLVKNTIADYQPIELKQIESFIETSVEFCFVYLMHDTSNGYYKIGVSNKPEYRERTLQSEKPTIELIGSKRFPIRKIAEAFEKALHDTYSEKRLRGEWFELDQKDVEHIKETLK